MKTPDEKVLKSISVMKNGSGFDHFIGWIKESLDENSDSLHDAPAERCGVLQGKCQVLKEIKKWLQDKDTLEKM